jgi:small subunit ribosomal protein S30e
MPTHGSLTKAGKVRSQTHKMAPKQRKPTIPRRTNDRHYEKRVMLSIQPGQREIPRFRR